MLMKNIDKRTGYKQFPNEIIGSDVKLTLPEKVGEEMKELIGWHEKNPQKLHPLQLCALFHGKFEKIHPFADGNGRVGRMILNYILLRAGFFPIIIRNNQRQKYIKALQAADLNKYIPLIRFCLDRAKTTYRKFFEVYYKYTKVNYKGSQHL